jgi:hypothetical protein
MLIFIFSPLIFIVSLFTLDVNLPREKMNTGLKNNSEYQFTARIGAGAAATPPWNRRSRSTPGA